MTRHAPPALVLALVSSLAWADEPPQQVQSPRLHRWGIEVEAIQPFLPTINIVRVRGSFSLWGTATGLRGDLLFGVYVRPNIEHDIVERISEYQVSVGYRQYVWRGLHAEVGLDAGYAFGRNIFDGREYRTPTLFLNTNIGYRFGFLEPGGFFENPSSPVGFFVIPQFGVLTGLGVADIGPRGGKPDVFLQGNLLLGVSF
jgi:hypothetical protein